MRRVLVHFRGTESGAIKPHVCDRCPGVGSFRRISCFGIMYTVSGSRGEGIFQVIDIHEFLSGECRKGGALFTKPFLYVAVSWFSCLSTP